MKKLLILTLALMCANCYGQNNRSTEIDTNVHVTYLLFDNGVSIDTIPVGYDAMNWSYNPILRHGAPLRFDIGRFQEGDTTCSWYQMKTKDYFDPFEASPMDIGIPDNFIIRNGDTLLYESDTNGEEIMKEYQSWNKGFTAGLQTAVDLLKSKTGATDDIEVLKMKMFAEYLKSKQ